MPVAKTYTKMKIQGEPFQENGRAYVYVLAAKGLKKVRWYSDTEYRRMYPDAVIEKDIMNFNARHAFGFGEKGYITLYKGKNIEDWAENDRKNIWYNLTFGYYTPSNLELPLLNNNIQPIQLQWKDVMDHDNKMKSHEEVQRLVATILNEESVSVYQGEVGSWIQETVTIREKKTQDSRFGAKHTYILEDTNGNTYIWETSAKDYPVTQTISLKMKVKEHKEFKGEKVTVVWYCKEC